MSQEQKEQCKRCVHIPTTMNGECIKYRRNELTLLCHSFLEKEEPVALWPVFRDSTAVISDGSTASYYELPTGATELQDLISYRNMNAQIGEIFRACYRYGQAAHSDQLRDAKKIMFYAKAEVERLEAIRKRPHRSLNVDGLAEYTTGTGGIQPCTSKSEKSE